MTTVSLQPIKMTYGTLLTELFPKQNKKQKKPTSLFTFLRTYDLV